MTARTTRRRLQPPVSIHPSPSPPLPFPPPPPPSPPSPSLSQAKPLQEHLTCPICFEVIRESRVVSACGHHFCKTCITESIGRSHRCPCCNVAVPSADSLRPDHQFDAICATFVEETAKSEQSYFARLIAGADADAAPAAAAAAAADGLGGGAGSAGSADPGPALTAIEQVFRQRLGQSLADHQAYLQQLAQRHAAARARLEASANNPADIAAQLRQLDDQHAHSVSLLAQAYDALLQTALPKWVGLLCVCSALPIFTTDLILFLFQTKNPKDPR